jgi:hypothetical protein
MMETNVQEVQAIRDAVAAADRDERRRVARLIMNLSETAHVHVAQCKVRENCGVSLAALRETAVRLLGSAPFDASEYRILVAYIDAMPS